MRHLLLLTLTAAAAFASAPIPANAAAPAPTQHVRGTIASVTPTAMVVFTPSGAVKVALPKSAGVITIVPSSRAAITDNTYVGIASFPSLSGTQRAAEVLIFPNAARGAGEGSYPWDLPAPAGAAPHAGRMTNGSVMMRSRMTNGTVMRSRMTNGLAGRSRMTNGTVSHAAAGDALTVTYKGGSQRITLPTSIPYVTFTPGTRAELKPGAHVVVFAVPGNPPTAARVAVGKAGLVPPM